MNSGYQDFADPADTNLVLDWRQALERVSRLEGQVHVDQRLAGIRDGVGDRGKGDSPIFASAKIGTVPWEAADFDGQAILAAEVAGKRPV